MSDEIKSNAEIVAEKLAKIDTRVQEPLPLCWCKHPKDDHCLSNGTACAHAGCTCDGFSLVNPEAKSPTPPPPQPQGTVFQWLLQEVGRMEKDIRAATKANQISTDGAKVVFKECVRLIVETQADEMRKQQEADQRFREFQARQEKRRAENAPFERPQ